MEPEVAALPPTEAHISSSSVIPLTRSLHNHTGRSIPNNRAKHLVSLVPHLEVETRARGEIPLSVNSGFLSLSSVPLSPVTPVGGRISQYLRNWQAITSDRWVLNIVKSGHTLEFQHQPPSQPPRATEFKHLHLLRLEADQLLLKGAIEMVPLSKRGKGFYSRFFLVQKIVEKWRPILDLRELNSYLIKLSFRMVSLQDILRLLNPGDYMATLDLEDAYFHVPIHPAHRKLLQFTVDKSHFQFKVLPFGLRSAPRIFTKVLAPVSVFLRKQRIQIFPYLDDWLVKVPSHLATEEAVGLCTQLFRQLGLQLNKEKLVLSPSRSAKFLGAVLDTVCCKAFPSTERQTKLMTSARRLCKGRSFSLHLYKSLMDSISSCIPLIPNCRLRMRPLQEQLDLQCRQIDGSFDDKITITQPMREAAKWWTIKDNISQGVTFKVSPAPLVITTDASLEGWGAVLQDLQVSGRWLPQHRLLHINLLELRDSRIHCLGPYGQHDGHALRQQAGGNKVPSAIQGSSKDLGMGYSSGDLSVNRASPRCSQQGGGYAQSPQVSESRVGVSPTHSEQHLQSLGHSAHRSFRRPRKQEMLTLYKQGSPTGIVGEYVFDSLVRRLCLRFSPNPSDSTTPQETQDGAVHDDSGGPGVASPVLVYRASPALPGSPSSPASVSIPANDVPGPRAAPESQLSPLPAWLLSTENFGT